MLHVARTAAPRVMHRSGAPIWGLFVLALGLWWLLGEMDVVPFSWGYVGPLALIAAGLGMILGWWRWNSTRA